MSLPRLAPIAPAALAFALLACAPGGPAEPAGVSVDPAEAAAFRERAEAFYQRLLARRFNTLETFKDPVLRRYFRSTDLFYDYYADFAQMLAGAHFEKSRPVTLRLVRTTFESPSRARVRVRFGGEDGRPLRWWSTSVARTDLWERVDGAWWVTPAKL